jgi:hypothetical protein
MSSASASASASASFDANTNRRSIVLSGRMVRLNASDGTSIDVPVEVCTPSTHISQTLEMSAEEELPILDFPTINGPTLRAIVAFMEEYLMEPFAPLPKTLPKEGLYSLIRPFFREFLACKMIFDGTSDPAVDTEPIPEEKPSLVNLLEAANTLDIAPLKKLVVTKMADVTRGKNIKDMFKIFNIPDHVPEWKDFEEIRQRHAYAFEDRNESETATASAAGEA